MSPQQNERKEDNLNKKKIVLIDDEEQVLRALVRELRDFAEEKNLEIITFSSSVIALENIEKIHTEIAIIISDQRMPHMKGCDLLNIVKGINPDIMLFLLTAYTDIGDIIKTIRAGLFSLILKPWNIHSLILELEKGLELFSIRAENKLYISRLKEELVWGGELQKRMLQKELPQNKKVDFSVSYAPVPEYCCGGDYYDIISFDDEHFMVLIGDVSGHGIKAAFVTFIIKTLVNKAITIHNKDSKPSDFLYWLNNSICEELKSEDSMLITFSACLFDLENNTLRISNAGHVPIKIIRSEEILNIGLQGTALGFQENINYEDHTEKLTPGDRVVFSTDGLIECKYKNESYDEILLAHNKEREFTDSVMNILKHLPSKGQHNDDMTLVSVQISP